MNFVIWNNSTYFLLLEKHTAFLVGIEGVQNNRARRKLNVLTHSFNENSLFSIIYGQKSV